MSGASGGGESDFAAPVRYPAWGEMLHERDQLKADLATLKAAARENELRAVQEFVDRVRSHLLSLPPAGMAWNMAIETAIQAMRTERDALAALVEEV